MTNDKESAGVDWEADLTRPHAIETIDRLTAELASVTAEFSNWRESLDGTLVKKYRSVVEENEKLRAENADLRHEMKMQMFGTKERDTLRTENAEFRAEVEAMLNNRNHYCEQMQKAQAEVEKLKEALHTIFYSTNNKDFVRHTAREALKSQP